MFHGNLLTFNPCRNEFGKYIEPFEDILKLQNELKSKNIPVQNEVDETSSGRASFVITDPDGNIILVDQHR